MKLFNGSIRRQLTIILIIIAILPLSIAMIITYISSRNFFNKEALAHNQNLMYQYQYNVNTYLSDICEALYYPYSNSQVYTFLTQKKSYQYSAYTLISSFMWSIAGLSDDITSIRLESHVKQCEYIYENTHLSINKLKDSADSAMTESKACIIPTHDHQIFTLFYAFNSIPQNEYIGTITIDVNLNTLRQLSSQMINSPDEMLYLVDRTSNSIIYSTDESLTGQPADTELMEAIEKITGSRGYFTCQLLQGNSILFYETVNCLDSQWLILKALPVSSLYSSIRHIIDIYLITYFVFLLLSILLIRRLSAHFTDPLIQLTRQMKEIKYGEPYTPLELHRDDEIQVLNQSFQSMLETINALTIQKYELKLSNKNAKLRMLQAQLNPHFMNNALQSLGTLALKKQAPELYSLITSLSLMMNYAMDINTSQITLDKEFEYAENYLIFQQQRFGETLHYRLDPSPETLSLEVPKMILQPIIENYFKHGFIKRPEGYHVEAESFLSDHHLIIVVRNNGESIPEPDLEKLKENLDHAKNFDNDENAFGIGLFNIQSRMNLYYNNDASISIRNLTPYGIEIRIQLNLEEKISDESFDY